MTRWRTCNNRRRRKEEIASWWLLGELNPRATPLTLDKMRAAIKLLSDPELARRREEALERWSNFFFPPHLVDPRQADDLLNYGIAITRDGERIDPNDFYAEPLDSESQFNQ